MKLTLESRPDIMAVNGVPARIWSGTTEKGTRVDALIVLVKARAGDDLSELDSELTEIRRLAGVTVNIPRKTILRSRK